MFNVVQLKQQAQQLLLHEAAPIATAQVHQQLHSMTAAAACTTTAAA